MVALLALLEVAHEGGGGFGGFFDFEQGTGFGGGAVESVGEDVGVGGDHAEKVIEGVSDDLVLGKGEGDAVGIVEGENHLGALLEDEVGIGVRQDGNDSTVEGVGGELIERDATGSATGGGLGVEFGDGRGVESDDREGWVFGANFLNIVKALKIPGVDVDDDGFPTAESESVEESGEGVQAMDLKQGVWSIEESARKFGPGRGLAEEEDLKDGILHRSCGC